MRLPFITPLILTAALALSACNRSEADTAPETDPPASSETEPALSIIRPDYQEPEMQLPLAALEARIGFDEEGYALNNAAKEELAAITESEQFAKGWPILLRAHSDSQGDDRDNLAASQKRGEAVQGWFAEYGVAEDRITLIAFGEQNPAEPNAMPDGTANEEGRAANRRVEISIAPLEDAENNQEAELANPAGNGTDAEAAPAG